MNSQDRVEFDVQMKKLCFGLNVLPSPDRLQAYFDGLDKMSLIQFGRVVDACLGEHAASNNKIPTIPQVWEIWHKVREKARATERLVAPPAKPHSRPRRHVTAMMFRYIHRRRMLENTQGNIDIELRTKAAEDLIKFLEASAADDLMPSDEEVEAMFNVAMERISDFEPATT